MTSVELRRPPLIPKRRSQSIFEICEGIATLLEERCHSFEFLNDTHSQPLESGVNSSLARSTLLFDGFYTTSTSEENILFVKTPTLDGSESVFPPSISTSARQALSELVSIFSSLDKVLACAGRTACVIKYMMSCRAADISEGLICLLFVIATRDYWRISRLHPEGDPLTLHRACQIISIFLKSNSPLRLPSRVLGFLNDTIDFEKHLFNFLDSLLTKASEIVTNELETFCESGIYTSSIPDPLARDTINKQEDLQLFHDILQESYLKLCSKGHKLLHVPRQHALLWCLKEVGRYFSEAEEFHGGVLEENKGVTTFGSQSSINELQKRPKVFFWQDATCLASILNYKGRRKTFLSVSRQAKERHDFTKVLLLTPTTCGQCNDLLWGFDAVECCQCQNCHKAFHIACRSEIKLKCDLRISHKLASNSKTLPAKYQRRISRENSRTQWIYDIAESPSGVNTMKRENLDLLSVADSSSNLPDSLSTTPTVSGSSIYPPHASTPSISSTSSFIDFSRDLPRDDDFFSLPETYECQITHMEFLQYSSLMNEEEDRLYLLSEVHYMIRKIVKDLQIMNYFATNIWHRDVENDSISRSFGFTCATELIPLYKDLQSVICRYKSQSTYRPFGGAFLEWLKSHQVQLFHLTSRLCSCIENKVIWQEVEKQRAPHGPFEAFFEFGYLRFNMKEWMKKLCDLLLIKFSFTIRNVPEKLMKMGFADEAISWREVDLWYRRLAIYQNTRMQPLMEGISFGRIDSDVASFLDNDLRPQQFFTQRRAKFKLFDDFLYDWQEVEVLSMTVTSSAYRHSNDFTHSIKPNQSSTQVSRINIKRKALLFLYHECLLFLLQSKNFRLKRLEIPLAGGNGASSMTLSPQRVLPVFLLENLVHCTLLDSCSNRMDLFFMEHENFSTQHVKINFSKTSEADKWKKYFCCCGSNSLKSINSPGISGASSIRKSQKRASAIHFRNPSSSISDPLFQHFINLLDEEHNQTERVRPELLKRNSVQGKQYLNPPPPAPPSTPQRARASSINVISSFSSGVTRPSLIQLSTQMSITESPLTEIHQLWNPFGSPEQPLLPRAPSQQTTVLY